MTLVAFFPYGQEVHPDAIVADLDRLLLEEFHATAKKTKEDNSYVFSVRFQISGGICDHNISGDDEDYDYSRDEAWLPNENTKVDLEFTLLNMFPDGDFYIAVSPDNGYGPLESCLFSIHQLEELTNGQPLS